MKHAIIVLLMMMSSMDISSQMLLENKEGDSQFIPIISASSYLDSSSLIKLNTGDESIGFDYFEVLDDDDRNKYKLLGIGLKSMPTEGYAALLRSNHFSPGVTIKTSLTQVKVFDRQRTKPENNFIDWGAIYMNYSINKYRIFKDDTVFSSQLYAEIFHGIGVGINYNMLIKSKFLISVKFGYARKSNYNDLEEVESKDIRTYYDSISGITRQVSSKTTARKGEYKEFDAYPLSLSFTKLTPDDPRDKCYEFGYNIYINTKFMPNEKTIANVGCILFLSRNKDGISTPVLGLNFQFDDFFNMLDADNGLFERLAIGLTSSISF